MTSKFISNKLRKELSSGNKFSKPIIKVAIISITISMLVMLISISVVLGFQREIKNKVINFSSHIQITQGGTNFSLASSPIKINQSFYPYNKKVKGIKHIQTFVIKSGIIQTKPDTIFSDTDQKVYRDIEGVLFKGIDSDYNWENLENKIIDGKSFQVKSNTFNDSILISNYLAKRLKLKVNDKVRGYFFKGNKPPAIKAFIISGIYETGLEEFDTKFLLVDIKHTQKLNGWGIFSSLFLETTLKEDAIVISANAIGGNKRYKYEFNEKAPTSYNKISFCAQKDTVIKVIITDYEINNITLENEPISIPDTAYLKIEVESTDGNCVTSDSDFVYISVNDSTRKYIGKNGTITTTLSSTGGSMKYYVGGFEIFIDDFNKIEEMELEISRKADPFLRVSKITDIEGDIFSWLNILDTNTLIIIVLMIIVAVINIISLLLVLIVEKIRMIGILKSFGSPNKVIQGIFMRLGFSILMKGILIGNFLAYLIIILQKQFGFITLPQEKYYLSTVPLNFEWTEFILINIITFGLGITVLYFTSLYIASITPIKAIKYE